MNTPNAPVPVPHADLQLEYVRQKVYGELAAGWWNWQIKLGSPSSWGNCVIPPHWAPDTQYRYAMTDKHPKYVAPKPKLKLVNMNKLPVGSVVSGNKYFDEATVVDYHPHNHLKLLRLSSNEIRIDGVGYLRIAEQKLFTYWGGGECPVPEGVRVEFVRRSGEKRHGVMFGSGFWRHGGNPDTRHPAFVVNLNNSRS